MNKLVLLLLVLSACAPLEAPPSEITVVPWGTGLVPAAESKRAFSYGDDHPCRAEIEEAFANLEKAYGVVFFRSEKGTPILSESLEGYGGSTHAYHAKEDIAAGKLFSEKLVAEKIVLQTCHPLVIAHEALHSVGLLHTTFGLMDGDSVENWDLNEEQVEFLLSLQ